MYEKKDMYEKNMPPLHGQKNCRHGVKFYVINQSINQSCKKYTYNISNNFCKTNSLCTRKTCSEVVVIFCRDRHDLNTPYILSLCNAKAFDA